jgi:hypothetical protein
MATAQNSSESKPEQTPAQTPEQTTQPETSPAQATQSVQPTDQPKPPGSILNNLKIFLPIILIVILVSGIAGFALVFNKGPAENKQSSIPTPTQALVKKAVQPTPVASKTQQLVYGTWTSQSSVVRAVDIKTDDSKTVATLPLTIKKITVLSPDTLLYIDQTDSNDHGARISVYNIKEQQITINIPASDGYGIDDYVLSPDKRYLAIWEVQFSSDTQTLQGGNSRVYAVDLTQPTITNLLYDESVTTTIPIHYPRGILNDGTVLTDQFIPDDPKGGTGWAYGMSKVDFDGTNKQDIQSMTNGTYGSQPVLSPDGKFMLFAGYDGSNGDGTAVKNGYRQALLTPNTVELLDTNTFTRYKLPNLPKSNIYSDVQWDNESGNVIISILSQDSKQMGVFVYDLSKLQYKQIPLPLTNSTQYGYISQLSASSTLIGTQSTDPSNLGNLGATYSYAYTQLASVDGTGNLTPLQVEDPFVQYITILPGDYFSNVLGAQTQNQTTPQPIITYAVLQGTDTTNPQDNTVFLKTTLASIRTQGISTPTGSGNTLLCQNLGGARCQELGLTPDSPGYKLCQTIEKANNRTGNACY